MKTLLFALILAGGASASLKADDISLGATFADVEVVINSNMSCIDEHETSATCSLAGSTANAVVTNGQGGSVSATAQQVSHSNDGALAGVNYYFGIEGPATESVPIVVNGFSQASDYDPQYESAGYAVLTIFSPLDSSVVLQNYFASQTECAILAGNGPAPCNAPGAFTINGSISSNTEYEVALAVSALGSFSSASLDPIIAIDPSFADADQFTLVANDGVFSSVPEPGFWGLVGSFLIALFVITRLKPIN